MVGKSVNRPLLTRCVVASLVVVALAGCSKEAKRESPPPDLPTQHAIATEALLLDVGRIVAVTQQAAAGEIDAAAALAQLQALQPALAHDIARRRALGPATDPAVVEIYADLEPRRAQAFKDFNGHCRRLARMQDFVKQAQAMMMPAIEALAAGAQ